MKFFSAVFLLSLLSIQLHSQKQITYKTPPEEILKLVDAPTTPYIIIDPTGEWLLQLNNPGMPSIAEVSQPELRIAGLRINPATNNKSRAFHSDSLSLTNLSNGKEYPVQGLPENPLLRNFKWSPDGKTIAFTHSTFSGLELWIMDVAKKKAEKLSDGIVNAAMSENPIIWADHGEWIIFTSVITERGETPIEPTVPKGPIIRQNDGEKAAVRTFQDLIKNEYDENLFEYYTSSQLIKINLNKESYKIGMDAIYKDLSLSPDGRFLLVEMIQKPYSYLVPYYRFPFKVEIWDNEGNLYRELFKIPAAENIPKGFGAVRKGPRDIDWRSDAPATIYWVQALDGGDPNKKAVTRDRLYLYEFPFDGNGDENIVFQNRFGSLTWGKEDFAICSEWWWTTRTEKISTFNPNQPEKSKQTLFEYNWQDEYNHPGDFMTKANEAGHEVLVFSNKDSELFLKGKGASPEGYKPFVDAFKIETKEKERLWQSVDPYYEYPIEFLNPNKSLIITRREAKTEPPNYFTRNIKNGVVSQITNFEDPYPQMKEVRNELIKYKRKDGVQLTGKLYLPPDFSVGDELLPTLMWAYPNEYKSAATAGQVKDSPNQFVRIGWWSPIFWVMRGYAVFDDSAMPIIGEGDTEPNNTFVEQLVANAEAAISCLDSLGISDKNRVAIGGHSYGAFMTANLLAHSDLFAAGIARSGAYNRTLTPFGFQSEERTFWEAREVYVNMSPFSYADKVNEPLLLIHGEADNNSGTYPLQSERYFAALKGNGATTRLVMLPAESHGYRARQSILHMLWEMDHWLEKYVKQK
ncbi:MAG: prolyl oligopeptidase family serine peptidase [Salinivirgaceae bacterium]|nr:prolyl oligopeptidase family serine peptidase [Salinivirgaceae bacterium]